MTITDATPTAPATDQVACHLAADDPRARMATAVRTATAAIGAVRPDELALPTPCPDIDVRGMLRHLVEALEAVAALGRGEDTFAARDAVGLDDDGGDPARWLELWLASAHDVQAVWSDDALLEREMSLPWLTASGGDQLLGYASEITVHTWDLARGTGQDVAFDEDLCRLLDDLGRSSGMPATGRAVGFAAIRATMPPELQGSPMPFEDAVPVADDAPAIDRLVAWNGRRP